jgi:hypothetical protein
MPFKVNKSIIKGTKQHKDLAFKLVRKKLDKGIAGEANNDGSVFVSKDVPKGSALEAEVINHEADHMARMKKGELGYTDDYVMWRGKKYPRKKKMLMLVKNYLNKKLKKKWLIHQLQ